MSENEQWKLHQPPELMLSEATANASETGGSIINQTGEALQTFVNKTRGVLGNISGEIVGNENE